MNHYIGLMSGTSMDGVDAAMVSLDQNKIDVVGALTTAYPESLHRALTRAIHPENCLTLHEFASLNINVGRCFARAANELLEKTNISRDDVIAIGSHGQTLRHSPDTNPPYSVQIGDPATIATRCSITTVADFRSMDLAAGGQGAPLVPAFHEAYFRHRQESTVVINIGGIANITGLPAAPSNAIDGFDTGPGNCLLDEWILQKLNQYYDGDGRWAASGHVSKLLLDELMADDYIRQPPPKSTGREYFNLAFIHNAISKLGLTELTPVDVQATLAEFSAISIVRGIEQSCASPQRVIVCGGGVKNSVLIGRLRELLPDAKVQSTATLNVDPDAIEATAFAWLAMQRLASEPVRVTTTSQSKLARVLGAIYQPGAL